MAVPEGFEIDAAPPGFTLDVMDSLYREPSEKTLAQSIAGNKATGVLYGAARPFIGAFQLGASVGDVISEKLGLRPSGLASTISEGLRAFEDARNQGRADQGLDIPVMAGETAVGIGALSKLPVLKNWFTRTLQGGGIGAGMGVVQPVTTDDGFGAVKGSQVATGAAVGSAIPLTGSLVGAGFRRFTESGRTQAAGMLANEAAGARQPQVVAALRANQNPLGQGTAGEVAVPAGSAEFSGLQRAMSSRLPSEYQSVARAQDAARVGALRTVGKTPELLQAAQHGRTVATRPLYTAAERSEALVDPRRTVNLIDRIIRTRATSRPALERPLNQVRETLFEAYPVQQRASDAWQNTRTAINKELARTGKTPEPLVKARQILNKVKNFEMDEFEALGALRKLKGKNEQTRSALKFAVESLDTPDFVVRQNPQALMNASKNISDLMNAREAGTPINQAAMRELQIIKRSLDNQIKKAVPEWRQAQQMYAEMSPEINQMQIGQYLEQKLVPALNDQGASAAQRGAVLAQALRDAPTTIKRSIDFGRTQELEKILTPDQMQQIGAVGQDLARKADFDRLAAAGAQKAGRLVGDIFSEQAANALHRPIMILNAVLRRTGVSASDRTLDILARKMMNPVEMAEIMEKATKSQQREIERGIMAFFTQQAAQGTGKVSETFLEHQ
jgi:hypothetical protein